MLNKFHYLFLSFLAYGFYGAGSLEPLEGSFSLYSIIFLILPLITTLILILFSQDDVGEEMALKLIDKNNIQHELLIFTFIAITLTAISLYFLSLSISNDAFFYATSALIHVFNIAEVIASKTQAIDHLKVSHVMQFLSFIIVSGLIIIGLLLYRLNISLKVKIAIFLCLILLLRFAIMLLGGNQNPHPPFTSLTFFLISPLAGINDLSAKLSFFIPYIFFAFFLYRSFNQNTSKIVSIILSIAVLSIPAILFLGSTVEQSLWGIFCFSISLVLISQDRGIDHHKIFFIIAVFCFFRSSSIFACMPVALHFLFYANQHVIFRHRIIKLIKASLPILLFVPFFLFTLLQNSETNIARISFDDNIFLLSWYVDVVKNAINALGLIPILLLGILILMTFRHKLFLIGMFFFIALMFVYNLIDEVGHPKYQLEYIVPMVIFCLLLFLKLYSSKRSRVVISVIAISVIINNVNLIWDFKDQCVKSTSPYNEQLFEYKAKFGCNFVSHPPFNLTNAYQELRRLDGFNSMYLPGVYYDGTLSQIMNGATVQEWRSMMMILLNQKAIERSYQIDWKGSNAMHIDNNNKINYVIIADVLDASNLKDNLVEMGWIVENSYSHKQFQTNVSLLARDENL